MKTTVIYQTLTKPELLMGLAKESLLIIGVVVVVFIFLIAMGKKSTAHFYR